MALKVAELFAELGIDSRSMERDADRVITLTARNMMRLADSAEQAGTESGRRLAEGLRRAADRGGPLLDPSTLYSSRDDFERAAADIGRSAGDGVGSGILDGMPDLSGGIGGLFEDALADMPAVVGGPALAAGAAVGALLAGGVATSLERGQIETQFEQVLGVNEATAARMGKRAGGIYVDNFGESVPQVAEAMAILERNTSGLADSVAGDMDEATRKVLTLSGAFGTDLTSTIRAATGLVKNGLAKDMREALDMITAGLQGPANAAGDLIDTLSTDSAKLRQFGLDGAESIGLIAQAMDEGAPSADFFIGMLEELAGNAADSEDVFARIGLGGQDMGARLSGGGRDAAEALDLLMDTLRSVEDPLVRTNAMVALFGEEGTAMQDVFMNLDLSTAVTQLGDVEGAADRAATAADDAASSLETLKRQAGQKAGDFVAGILDPLYELGRNPDPNIGDVGRAIGESLIGGTEDGVRDSIGPGTVIEWIEDLVSDDAKADAEALGYATGEAFARGLTAAQSAQADGQPTGFAPVEAGTDWTIDKSMPILFPEGRWAQRQIEITADASQAVASVDQVNDLLELSAELADIAGQRGQMYLDRIGDSSGLDDMLISALDLSEATWGLSRSLQDLSGNFDVSEIAAGNQKAMEDQAGVLRDIASVGADAQGVIAGVLQWEGEAAATERAGELREQFQGMFEDAGYTTEQVNELLELMGLTDWQIEAGIRLSGADEAMAKIMAIRAFMTNEDGTSGIPAVIETQIALAISQDRATDAETLLNIWLEDRQDGMITNPLLVQMGLGDTAPAEGEIDGWKAGEEAKPGPVIDIDANTAPARAAAAGLFYDISRLNPKIIISAETQIESNGTGVPFSIPYIEAATGKDLNGNGVVGRRVGGAISPGTDYLFEGDPEIIRFDMPGTVIPAPQTRAMLADMSPRLTPMPGTFGSGGYMGGSEGAVLAELRELRASLGRPNVTIPTEVRTTASAPETLAEIRAHAEAGIIAAMGPG